MMLICWVLNSYYKYCFKGGSEALQEIIPLVLYETSATHSILSWHYAGKHIPEALIKS